MTEELAFNERGRDGGAIHDDERTVASAAGAVDRPCHQILSGARFAHDEHGRVGVRYLPDIAQDMAEAPGCPRGVAVVPVKRLRASRAARFPAVSD